MGFMAPASRCKVSLNAVLAALHASPVWRARRELSDTRPDSNGPGIPAGVQVKDSLTMHAEEHRSTGHVMGNRQGIRSPNIDIQLIGDGDCPASVVQRKRRQPDRVVERQSACDRRGQLKAIP